MHSATPQPKRLGPYQVKEALANGRVWQIYRCFDPIAQRNLVLKTIPKAVLDSSGALPQAETEARAAAGLKHPGIVEVYGYGEDAGLSFVAMEYVEGWYLKGRFRVALSDAVNLMVQLLEALDYAHSRGLVHRAIKPSNLLLTTSGQLRISNFGVPRLGAGSNHYTAPEALNDRVVDGRSDVYSAGVVFYELLTGVPPFPKQSGVPLDPLRVTPRPVSQINSSVPKVFDAVCAMSLAQTAEERYASARRFSDGVRSAVAGSNAPAPSPALPRESVILFASPESGPRQVEGTKPGTVDTKAPPAAPEANNSRSGAFPVANRVPRPEPNPAVVNHGKKHAGNTPSPLGLASPLDELLGSQPNTLAGYLKDRSSQSEEVIDAFVASTKALIELYAGSSGTEALLPQNICFDRMGKASIRVSPANAAHNTAVMSNPRYAAPEMFAEKAGAESSPAAANIYALGFMFYEILLGKTLFEKTFAAQRSDLDWLRWHADLQNQAPPLKSLLADCSLALSQLVESMLAKPVEKRITDLNEILSRLRRVQQQSTKTIVIGGSRGQAKPIAKVTPASRTSLPKKTKKKNRRKRALVIIAIIVILLLGLAGFLLWQNPDLYQEVITYLEQLLGRS